MTPPRVIWTGDRTIHVVVGEGDSDAIAARVVAVGRVLRASDLAGVVDVACGSGTVQVLTEGGRAGDEGLCARIAALAEACVGGSGAAGDARVVEIPVCYGGELGPDLAWMAARCGMAESEVVRLHSAGVYTVRFLGFAPGFAYLAGLPGVLHAPRLETPRTRVRAGSVGIADGRTGVYPAASPGGWRLIGATPLRMFDPGAQPAARLAAGDRVRFVPIDRQAFDRMSLVGGAP